MNTRIAFRNMEHNPHIEEYAHKELHRLNKFLQADDATILIDLVMNVEGVDHRLFHVELRVHDKHGELVAHQEERDIYRAISHVVHKLVDELSKAKSVRLDLLNRPNEDKDPIRKDKADFEK